MTHPHPPNGERIATEVEKEMQLRLFRLRHSQLAPSEYHVYLHPDDFEHVKGIVHRIVHDVQESLNLMVKRRNTRSPWSRLMGPGDPPIEIPPGGWAVHIKPAVNGDVGPGELGIHSRLAVPAMPTYGSGAGTVRIVHTIVSGTDRRVIEQRDEEQPPVPKLGSVPPTQHTDGSASTNPSGPRVTFRDDTGPHIVFLTKDVTKIGRGGEEHWVDIALTTGTKVSREHCQIRRDASGRCVIRDVSQWGTRVNGQPVPRNVAGDASLDFELPENARIELAESIVLDFRVR